MCQKPTALFDITEVDAHELIIAGRLHTVVFGQPVVEIGEVGEEHAPRRLVTL